ncbi:MAG TPA: hypothetical protein VFA20_28990 [Myxococcaceae bacterium]|nr:hypothetical protein [Myxococcaceae bacterium]
MLATLLKLQLLKGEPPQEQVYLLRMCAEGSLVGGMSVALGVRPDELFGYLAALVGGVVRRLKVLDVRDEPSPQMVMSYGPQETPVTWHVPNVRALVDHVNRLGAESAVAVLGEWEDALQLWCLPRSALRELLQEPGFRPENLAELEPLATS